MTNPLRIAIDTVTAWIDDGGPQWSAAIAYYAVLSLAPMVILVSALVGLAFEEMPTAALRDQLEVFLGRKGAEFAMGIVEDSAVPDREFPGLVGNGVILLVGATIVLANVQTALNRVWGLRWIRGGTIRGVLRQRVLAFAMIVVTGAIMLISVGLSTVVGLASGQLETLVDAPELVPVFDAVISVLVLAVLFGATFRILPDGDVAWRDVLLGATVTSVLFVVGKLVVAFYLTHASVVGAYGVAGSLVFFLIWVYYSAAIFFLGAEFTEVWARAHDRPITPHPGAVRVEEQVVRAADGEPVEQEEGEEPAR